MNTNLNRRQKTIAGTIAGAAIIGVLTIVGVASCSSGASADPTPSASASASASATFTPTPPATPTLTPEEVAVAAAKDAVTRYIAVDDAVSANPKLPLSAYDAVSVLQARTASESLVKLARKKGLHTEGPSTVISMTPVGPVETRYDPLAKPSIIPTVKLSVCSDSSNAHLVNAKGQIKDIKNRVTRFAILMTVIKPPSADGKWTVSYLDPKGQRC